jgi:hypothetical protein
MTKNKFARPRKRNLNQNEVGKFLTSIGFETELIAQEWRHLHAFGKYQGKDAVFKLASTQSTSPKTQNEFNWNEAVHLTRESKRPNFTVPQNYSSGEFGKLFYFIAQRFMGDPFVTKDSKNITNAISKIPQIAKATYELINLPIPDNCAFTMIQKSKEEKKISTGHKLLQSSTEWAGQVPQDLNKFLSVIEKSKDSLGTSVGHGDFVIRQMYDVNGKIGIIDGEHAGAKGPKYYDVAQFYIRLRNDYDKTKNIAKDYLEYFKDLLSDSQKGTFWEELKPVLIQRYIGDLWGAAKNPQKLQELKQLGDEILDDKII